MLYINDTLIKNYTHTLKNLVRVVYREKNIKKNEATLVFYLQAGNIILLIELKPFC